MILLRKYLFVYFNGILMLSSIFSCNSQTTNDSALCISHFKNARKIVNDYYKNNDSLSLKRALSQLEFSIQCKETRSGSIDLKISLLIALKEYKSGYNFIEELKTADFRLSYKKKMYADYFKALAYQKDANEKLKIKYFQAAIAEVQTFINNNKNASIENREAAFYDLVFMKSRIMDQPDLANQIDSIKKINPEDSKFLEILKTNFYENEISVQPVK